MTRSVWVYRDGKMIPKAEAPPLYAAPMIHRDQMDPLLHPATGRIIDSKSKFRQTTKDAGCIEVGTSSFPAQQPKYDDRKLVNDVGKAIQMVREGYKPNPLLAAGIRGDGWHD